MATITAQANGNWSAGSTWVGGVAPGSGDVAALATFAVTIDQDITVQAVTHTSATGKAIISSGTRNVTVTAPQLNTVTSSTLFEVTGGTANFTGDYVAGSTLSGRTAISVLGGVANVATATGGAGGSSNVAVVVSGGTANVSTATGGGATGCIAVQVTSGGTATVANATGGSNASAHAVTASSGSTVTVTNAIGGTALGLSASAGSTVTVVNATASTTSAGASSASTTARITGTATSASNGRMPVDGIWLIDGAASFSLSGFDATNWPSAVGNPITLSAAGSSNPTPSNVRAGVTYGTSGSLTGTLAVPSAASVAAGIPVDNTVGTAALRLSDVASVTGAQIAAATTA